MRDIYYIIKSWAYLPLSLALSFFAGTLLSVNGFRRDIYFSFGLGLGFSVGFIIIAILDHIFDDNK